MDGKDLTDGRPDFGLSSTANPEEAKKALAEAGISGRRRFPDHTAFLLLDDNVKKIAEAVKEMWEQNLGIKVEVSSADWAVFYSDVQPATMKWQLWAGVQTTSTR